MHSSELASATWRKSSRSNDGSDGNCVEVAELADQVAMRDSKDPAGPALVFPRAVWSAFLSGLRTGHLT